MNVTDRAMAREEWVRIEALELLFGVTCDRIRELEEAIELMLCEVEGIEVGFENGCKGAALMVGQKALGIDEEEAR
jgi:hypothetical protein